jgi:hypothetical protein
VDPSCNGPWLVTSNLNASKFPEGNTTTMVTRMGDWSGGKISVRWYNVTGRLIDGDMDSYYSECQVRTCGLICGEDRMPMGHYWINS